jgi:hypothetical protein
MKLTIKTTPKTIEVVNWLLVIGVNSIVNAEIDNKGRFEGVILSMSDIVRVEKFRSVMVEALLNNK